MIAVRRVVVAFVASLATLLLAGPVAAVAPPSDSHPVAVHTCEASRAPAPVTCDIDERGSRAAALAASGRSPVDRGSRGDLCRDTPIPLSLDLSIRKPAVS